jgi:hypothetical protein
MIASGPADSCHSCLRGSPRLRRRVSARELPLRDLPGFSMERLIRFLCGEQGISPRKRSIDNHLKGNQPLLLALTTT